MYQEPSSSSNCRSNGTTITSTPLLRCDENYNNDRRRREGTRTITTTTPNESHSSSCSSSRPSSSRFRTNPAIENDHHNNDDDDDDDNDDDSLEQLELFQHHYQRHENLFQALLKAAQRGCIASQTRLGTLYSHGLGARPKEPAMAVYWWQRAVSSSGDDDNNTDTRKTGTAKRTTRRRRIPEQHASWNETTTIATTSTTHTAAIAEAQCGLASFYELGMGGLPQCRATAARYLQQAARHGHAHAQYLWGLRFFPKKKKSEDKKEHDDQKENKENQNNKNKENQNNNNNLKDTIQPNVSTAMHWIQLAAGQGHALAKQKLQRHCAKLERRRKRQRKEEEQQEQGVRGVVEKEQLRRLKGQEEDDPQNILDATTMYIVSIICIYGPWGNGSSRTKDDDDWLTTIVD